MEGEEGRWVEGWGWLWEGGGGKEYGGKVKDVIFLDIVYMMLLSLFSIFRKKMEKDKTVSFAEKNEVFVLEDDDDVREYRKLYWEFFCIDRARFKRRIGMLSVIINPVLTKEHRYHVYEKLNVENV